MQSYDQITNHDRLIIRMIWNKIVNFSVLFYKHEVSNIDPLRSLRKLYKLLCMMVPGPELGSCFPH